MRKEIITIGQTIDTIDGYIIITGAGSDPKCVFVDEYTSIWDEDEPTDEYTKESHLITLYDIERRMRDVDGQNHDLMFANAHEYAEEAREMLKEASWETITNYMDDVIRESVHKALSPCSNEDFLAEYMARHGAEYNEVFTI